jgi:hypothetical protein
MRAVVVTRDPESLRDIRHAWATDGIETDVVISVENACRDLPCDSADLVVLDDTLPLSDALRLYSTVRTRENATSLPIIYRCPDILSPDWAVRDYYVPPAADPGTLIMLGHEVLGPGSHEPGRSNGHRTSPQPTGLAAGGNGTARAERATAVTTAPAIPRPAETWRAHLRAARGRSALAGGVRNGPAALSTSTSVAVATSGRRRFATGTEFALLPFLLRWSWVLLIATAVGLAGSYGYLQSGRLPYQSKALLTMRPQYDSTGEALVATNPARIATASQALSGQADSPSVYEATSRALSGQLEISGGEIGQLVASGQISITPVRTSSFIEITASDQDPERAWLLADGYTRGILADLAAQTQLVTEQQKYELQIRQRILQRQLAAVPAASNPRLGSTFGSAQEQVMDDLIQTQTKLEALAQPQLPVMRYGETSTPSQTTNVRRVLLAGAAAGGLGGLVIAYLLELLRQRRSKRARRAARCP